MFSERIIENKQNVKPDYQFFKRYNKKYPERGGYKKDDRFTAKNGAGPQNVLKVRKSLERIINEAYEKNWNRSKGKLQNLCAICGLKLCSKTIKNNLIFMTVRRKIIWDQNWQTKWKKSNEETGF